MASNNNNKGNHNGDSSTGKTLFGNVDFEEDNKVVIRRILERKMQPEHLSTRVGAGRTTFTYIESWKAIELANGIFGFDGWSSSITDMILDFIEPVCGGARFKCGVTAIVRVTLKNGSFHEDVGFGIGENKCKGTALEKAKKEAVSDARKRALRLFGNALGNSVYDKEFIESIDVPTKKQPGRMGNQQSSYASPITYDGIRQSERSFSSPISRNGLPLPSPPPPPLPPPSNTSNSNTPLNQPQQQVHNQQQMSPQGNQLYYQQHQHQQSPPQHLKSKVQIQGPPLTSPQQHPSTTGSSTSSTSTASGLQQYQKDNNSNNVNNVNNVINISSNENSFDMTSGTANENENENDDASFLDGFDLSQIGRELSDDAIDKQPQQEQPQLSNGQNISPIQRKQPPPPPPQQQQQQQSNNNNNNGEEIDDDADLFGKIDLDDVMLFDDDDDNNNNNNINKGSDDKQKTPSPQANLSGNDTVLVPESTKHHSQEQKHQQQLSPGMPPKVNISQIDQVKRNLFMPGPQSPQNKGFNNNNVGNVGNVGSSRNQYSSPPQSTTTTTTTTTSSYSPVVAKNYSKPPPSKRFTIFVGKK